MEEANKKMKREVDELDEQLQAEQSRLRRALEKQKEKEQVLQRQKRAMAELQGKIAELEVKVGRMAEEAQAWKCENEERESGILCIGLLLQSRCCLSRRCYSYWLLSL